MRTLLQSHYLKRSMIGYTVLLVLVIGAAGLALNSYISRIVERDLAKVAVHRLTSIDSLLAKGIWEPVQKLAADNMLSRRVNAQTINPYAQWEMNKSLRAQIQQLPYVESVNVYYPGEDLLVSSNAVYYQAAAVHADPLLAIINGQRFQITGWQNWSTGRPAGVWSDREKISYLLPSLHKVGGEPKFVVYVTVNTRQLFDLLSDQTINLNERLLLGNASGRILAMGGQDQGKAIFDEALLNAGEGEQLELNHFAGKAGEMSIGYSPPSGGWSYMLVMPMSEFLRISQAIKQSILFVAASSLLLGLLLAGAISLHQYRPIRRLIEIFAVWQGGGAELQHGNNEMAVLQEKAGHLVRSVHELRSRAAEHELIQLLKGTADLSGGPVAGLTLVYPLLRVVAVRKAHPSWEREVEQADMQEFFSLLNAADKRQVYLLPYSKELAMLVVNDRESAEPLEKEMEMVLDR